MIDANTWYKSKGLRNAN